mgnify:CR=1 FL=1
MKFNFTYLILLFATATISAQTFKTPVDYLNYIGKEQTTISRTMWKYTSAVAHSKSARKIDATRKQLVKSIQTASKKISDLKDGYNGDVDYRNKVVDYLKISENSINNDYDKIIDMQEVAEQSYDYMEAYILARDLVNEKIAAENEKVVNEQRAFALKYKITLSEDSSELGKKIKISNEVFDYHTAIYLLFFKANITDLYLSNAIEKKDLGAIQQNANSLLLYSNEGIEKLKTMQPYKGDSSLLLITKKALEYYKKEAEKYVPNVVSFFMFNEKFENAKKTLEAKSQKDRTKEEIENYNGMVKQINNEIQNYNKVNTANVNEKNNAISLWNQTGENFISKHVPQD